ncbi:MAG TPA: NAD(P)H-dependent oxidoreductase [Pseudonocardiaceae bacterium]|nr:NAD(P)H-dependent oxidoreductase [Pseudonocardiaceae bacterium]
MIRIAIVVGSTRPRRRGELVARWVGEVADEYLTSHPEADDVEFETVDIAEQQLPLLDEPIPAAIGDYSNSHTKRWASLIGSFDGFIFVTPEYNHSVPAALKNALDYLFAEWNDKAAGFVSYGLHGGTRAVEHLRLVMAELKIADVRTQVALSLFNDFAITDLTQPGELTPGDHQRETLNRLVGEVITWASALKPLRARTGEPVRA